MFRDKRTTEYCFFAGRTIKNNTLLLFFLPKIWNEENKIISLQPKNMRNKHTH